MSRMHYRLGISVVLLAFFSAAANAEILRVDQDSSGGDGSTWGLAFNNLQSCLAAAANGDEIWVADGTYLPGTSPTSSFTLISSIPELSLYGGFQGISRLGGGETAKAQRDFLTYKSVLTGDIPDTTDDCENVIRDETSDDLIILDGFTITGGVGTSGAGMVIISGSGPTIVNCRFIGNGPRNFSSDSFGGAIHFQGNSAAQVIDCVFENNRARQGGAIWLPSVSTFAPTIQRCRFEGNVAYWRGGAIENLNYTSSPGVQIRECRFIDNIAYAAPGEGIDSYKGGGAISNEGGLATLTNCVFIGNESAQNGGAINNFSNSNSFGTLTLRSCTLSENTAAWQAGGIWMQNGTMTLRNIVLWSNHDKDGTASSATQFNDNSNSPDVKYSCIQDDAPGGSIPYGSGSPNFNIDTDPVFINPSVGNLRLGSAGSGCVNSGNNSDVSGVSTDIDGRMRIMDTTVDRGAHESAFTLSGPTDCDSNSTADDVEIAADPSKDCNNNGILDICDVTPIGSGADCNSNGVPDDCDIASGTSFDCNTNGVPDDCEFEDCNHDCIDDSGQSLDDCDENESADVCEIAPPKRWTTDEDFEEGIFINSSMFGTTGVETGLRKNPPDETSCLPYIWVPGSGRGTVLLIRSDETPSTGNEQDAIKGEYRTGPVYHKSTDNGSLSPTTRNPLGLTVDLDGSVWITNYGDRGSPFTGSEGGSVTKIGMVIGGTRVNASGVSDSNGGYLHPPFDYCTCEDRDGDGLIRTSSGLTDILDWGNYNGKDDPGAGDGKDGVENAEDECILRYTRLKTLESKVALVDRNNDVWVGGLDSTNWHQKLDGFSAQPLTGSNTEFYENPYNRGAFDGLIDCAGFLWLTSDDGELIKVDSTSVTSITEISGPGNRTSGIAMDTQGVMWVGSNGVNKVFKVVPPSGTTTEYGLGSGNTAMGSVTVRTVDDQVWTANKGSDNVSRLTNGGSYVNAIDMSPGFEGECHPVALSVDSVGKVWVLCRKQHDGSIRRIDPDADSGLGDTDLVIPLNDDEANNGSAYPGEPIDILGGMTSTQTHLITGTAVWTDVYDGGIFGQEWARIAWNHEVCGPREDELRVFVRAADRETDLAAIPYAEVADSGVSLVSIVGRFVQVRVQFNGTCPSESTPITPFLCDLALIPAVPCCKGDVNGDTDIDGKDIQGFVNLLMSPSSCLISMCAADIVEDAAITLEDLPAFVTLLLTGGTCATPRYEPIDCNDNGISDENDLFLGNSLDCNANGIPDECEIDENSTAEGGPWYCESDCATDVNDNGIPDGCEDDCNTNGIPDSWDISETTSDDVNTNGVPDECEPDCNTNGIPDAWDISETTSADCNTNGIPDECEDDCNTNGVPDDCDVDITDPDGDEWVSPDCNEDGYPDECNLALAPPFGSLDCNTNGIPDECDIADCESDPACDDCNENGIPDGCDIAAEISEDTDTNGIPDECEEESLMGGGGGESMMSESEWSEEEAWEAFHDWAIAQCWGLDCEAGMDEQFTAMIAKLQELGLPARKP